VIGYQRLLKKGSFSVFFKINSNKQEERMKENNPNLLAQVAEMIYKRGAMRFGEFKLKLHEKNPDAPLSPFYLNLRGLDHPKNPGPLLMEDFDLIAKLLMAQVRAEGLEFGAIAGLPYAADPIIAAIIRANPKFRTFRVIKLAKEIMADERRIVPQPGFAYEPGERVLLFDDLITQGDSKLEAIRAIEESGSVVAGLAVLIDRNQGGAEQLAESGYRLFSCFVIQDFLLELLRQRLIDRLLYHKCILYLEGN
jgi:orotate phosphoribosyltransferase